MRTTSFRRTVAALLAAALGTGTLVAGSAPSVAAPVGTTGSAGAAMDIAAARDAVAGTLDWGVKASFRNYITGPIAHGSIEVRDPATRNADGTFRFADATGTADPDAGTAGLAFAGEVYFAGHDMGAGPLLELTVTDPRVTVSSATEGVLVADVDSLSLDSGQLVTYDDVELADLDLTDHPLTFDGDTVSAAGVPATLTAAGVPAFANFYTAGTVLDPITFTATLEEAQPVWEPSIEVFAADGVTPAADADLTYGDTVVVKGEGFDPAGNVAPEGNRPPIPAGVPAGTYVVFGKFAEQWRPSAGAPSSARTVGTQKWALAQAALDQVPAQYQSAIRAQWADVQPDGTFTAELTLAKPTDRTTGEAVEWPTTGDLGIYTYAAGGAVNADQELTVPVTVAEQPDPEPIEVTDATFEWGINLVSQYGSPAGACSFFVAGIADGTEASYKAQDGDVYLLKRLADGRATAVTAENRCLPLVDDKINQRALFTGGTGELDAAGAGSIAWTGAFTIYSYGGMVPWYVKDPVLTIDGEGNGAITAEVGGFASSMEDPTVKEPLDPEQGVTILELDGVAIEDGVVTGTPVYRGVDYFPLNDPADPASGRRETSAIPDQAKAANPNWGSWPTPIVDFHYRTGLSSYWHTSGLSADPNKPPLPVLLELDGGVPEFVDAHPVSISGQPQWAQAVTGEDATFTVTAESEEALTYQWQRRNPGTSDWVAVDGATGSTLTLPGVTPADTGTYVRVVVANSTASTTSSAAGLQVQDAAVPALGSSPADVTTFVGYQAQFAADIAGWPRPTYQWQTSTDGGETWTDHGEAGNASSIELTGVTADQDGLRVRAVGSNGRGADVVTEAAELTVLPAPSEPTLAFPEGAEFDPAAEFLVLTAVGGGYPVPTGTVTLAVVEADVWAARDDTFDRETDTIAWSEIHSSNFTGGFFDAGLYVEPGLIDPEKDYVLVTFSITPGDHSHDAEAAIPFGAGEQPTWEPSIEVFAADGVTPVAEAELTYGDTVVVRGSGFDPEGNVAPEGNRPPLPAGVPAGAYVVFGSFADQWQPSQGAPSSARTVGAQQWALAQAALDQVPAQYQDAIRAQWVEIAADGTFTAELTLAKPTDRTTGEPVEWPDGTTPGVYTYAAGGTVNADQELSVPLTVADEEPPTGTGTLDWGLKASFRNYITGPIAHGSIEVREPATRNEDGTFRFADGTGTGSAEAAELTFAGEVYFSGHDVGAGPLLELTVTDPRVTVTSADAGVLVADVVSKSLDSGELVTYDDVEFATLDFTGHPVTVTDGVAAASGVPAALTEAGAAAFAGFYTAGTELDPVTFSVALEDEPPAPTPTIVVSDVEDLDPYADQITVTGSGFEPADLAGGLRVGVGVVTTDGSVPALDPVETVTFEPVSGLLSFARAALGTFEVTLTTGEVEPGTTLAVHTSPVDASADPAYTTQTPIAFADVRTPQLTVTPTEELAVGTEVRVEGTGFAPNRRISLAITANAEQDPEYGWPTGWLQHEVVQADASGALSRTLTLAGTVTGSGVDCVETACFVASFSSAQASDATPVDYRADRSQDVLVAVAFATDPGPEPEPPAVTVDPDPAVQGEPVTFTGTGFEPGATVTAVVDRDALPSGGTGTLDWGVKESFRTYINGPIAHGSIEVRDPATENADGTFRFAEGTGDATALAFGGEVHFSGHDMGAGPLLELTITDPRVAVSSADAGVLVADVVSKSLSSGELVTYDDVELAALDFTDHPVTETDGVVAASDVPAALTEDGVAAFADFYPAGTELDPVTFAVPADGARATAASVEAGTGTAGDDGTVEIGWTVPADFATGGHTVDLVVADESLASTAFTVEEADKEPEPEPDPAVSVDPETVAQGGTVTFTGTDFGAEESVEATILIDAATEELTFDNDHGQAVTVRSADGNPLVQRDGNLLVVDGGELDVTLTGLEPTSEENTPEAPAGFYLLTAVDNGPGEVATPAIGGADTTGESGTSRWITNFPYPGSEDIVVPIADGVAETSLTLVAADEYADCEVGCVLYLRTDHRSAANRAFDLRVPLEFVSADELAEAAQTEPVTVSGTTNADGEVALGWTVPADSPVGPATVTLTGADSALTASAPFTVIAASPGGDDNGSDEGGSDEGGSEDGSDDGTDGGSESGGADDSDGDLPDTGTDPSVILIAGLALLAGGVAVALYDRRRRV